jgi:hypothetical protein
MDHRPPEHLGHGVVCEDRSGPYEVSLDHFVNHVAAVRRNHPTKPPPSSRSSRRRSQPRCLASRRRGTRLPGSRAGRHLERPSIGSLTFEPAASPPPPPHPRSPGRTGHQLPNFNDQSSGRTHTSSPTKLPGVPRSGPRPKPGAVVPRGERQGVSESFADDLLWSPPRLGLTRTGRVWFCLGAHGCLPTSRLRSAVGAVL